MQAGKPSARVMICAAVLLMAGIIAWRVSGPLGELIHAYSVHVSLTGQPARHVTPKPAVRPLMIPPKVCQLAR